MKILLCHNYYKIRAGEAVVFDLEKELLEKNGNQVIVYTRDNKELDSFSLMEKLKSFLFGFYNPKTVKDIKEIIEKNRPDVAHIHNVFPLISPSIYRILKKNKIPIVQTFHNFRFFSIDGLIFNKPGKSPSAKSNLLFSIFKKKYKNSFVYSAWYAGILRFNRKVLLKYIDKYIALNSFNKKLFADAGIPENKLVVVPNPASASESFFKNSPENYLLFAGRLSEEKGIITFLKAVENFSELPVKIIGSGHLEKETLRFISEKSLENVEFLGQQDKTDFDKYLANALVTIFPSECYENCSLTVVNSIFLGTPVLAANVGGITDFVIENKTGYLFESGNVEELTDKLFWIKNNLEEVKNMRKKVREYGEEQFSEEKNYKQLMRIFDLVPPLKGY